ncbi:kinesin-like protein KIN-14S, partial [Tanacetum coccineum]
MKEHNSDLKVALQKYREEVDILKKRYDLECSERRRLHNELIELKGNIRVFVRCRPLNHDEIARGPEDNQEAVFEQTSPLVVSVLDGFNVCIFAYGQTGTGKTFTMEGTADNRGVNYRTLEKLFRLSEERSEVMRFELSVSMLEVYNEKIRDLLVEDAKNPAKKLEVIQSEVPGLKELRVHRTDQVLELLKRGSRARSVGSTNANEFSSRSHCLLRVTVVGENLVNGQRTRSRLWLVDLAGSERAGKTGAEGERLTEANCINKSLSALRKVISDLVSKEIYVSYRDSKLTHLLESSLGGDCKTLMFVQISPSQADQGETISSLRFARDARCVEGGPAHKQKTARKQL